MRDVRDNGLHNDHHATVSLEIPGDSSAVPIDRRMVPLIRALWCSGFVTKFCCEGDPWCHPDEASKRHSSGFCTTWNHPAYISFADRDDLTRFIEIADLDEYQTSVKYGHSASIYFFSTLIEEITPKFEALVAS